MKDNYDQHAGSELSPLHDGQRVRVQNPDTHIWEPAVVTKVRNEPKSYEVTTPNGSVLRRNRAHIREIPLKETTKIQPKKVRFMDEPNNSPTPKPASVVKNQPTNCGQEGTTMTTRSGRAVRMPTRYRDEL